MSDNPFSQRSNLLIRSWNIQHINSSTEGIKTEIPEFTQHLSSCNIFCLQETVSDVNIPNFRCFNKKRKSSSSGGICIGIHRSLTPGCSNYSVKDSPDIQGIKLRKEFFGLKRDVVLFNVYNSPENSSYKMKTKASKAISTLDILASTLNDASRDNDIILMGDLNSRISEKDDYLIDDNYNPLQQNSEWIKRTSMDKTTNSSGGTFIDMIIAEELVILNGRTLGDLTGNFTCLKYNGNSVIDYAATSIQLHDSVKSFKVLPFTPYSDHKPIEVCLAISKDIGKLEPACLNPDLLDDQPIGYKWAQAAKDAPNAFLKEQSQEDIKNLTETILNKETTTKEEVIDLMHDMTNLYTSIADRTLKKKRPGKMSNKNKWFDWDCRFAKRDLSRLSKNYCKNPLCADTRQIYYSARKSYKKLIKSKKDSFLKELNCEIETGGVINWAALKKLKASTARPESSFDMYDMYNMYSFFKKLYAKNNLLSKDAVNGFKAKTSAYSSENHPIDDELSQQITLDELTTAMKKLKSGKSASEDNILNEMLKNSSENTTKALLKLFNACLQQRIYPWNGSLMTLIHKKGDRYDANNYRSICVGSNMGKLFSSILLQRLIIFRAKFCKDYPNQLGFCKNAQTNDHLLTLSTIIDKYSKKMKKRVFTCFVDYKKAFDTVCREALLFKLAELGVGGNFFGCIENMYQNSSTRIKLLQKISDKIDILVGTEQGHVMSPEFFKIYIRDLTPILDNDAFGVPELNGTRISHLLWADDLVILALDHKTLQAQINELNIFCRTWGLEANFSKTQILIFNKAGRRLDSKFPFLLGEEMLQHTSTYCYLGMIFAISGSYKPAKEELRKKTLRAYFSLKRTIDFRHLTTKAINNLYSALVKPVLSYACPIWYSSTHLARTLKKDAVSRPTETLKKLGADEAEMSHLRYIKWLLGVHKKTSNVGAWGDSGRPPILLDMTRQVLEYYKRAESAAPDTFIHHAFKEQVAMNLDWYSSLSSLISEFSNDVSQEPFNSENIVSNMVSTFVQIWKAALESSRKLSFYRTFKENFGTEEYLDIGDLSQRRAIAKIRLSAHPLAIETGRYSRETDRHDRRCQLCSDDLSSLRHLHHFDAVIQDEWHLICTCPAYNDLRCSLPEAILSEFLQRNQTQTSKPFLPTLLLGT